MGSKGTDQGKTKRDPGVANGVETERTPSRKRQKMSAL